MPDAEVRVHAFSTGRVRGPWAYFARPDGPLAAPRAAVRTLLTPPSRRLDLPIPVFLLEHPEHGPVVVDTGVAEACADGRGAAADVGRLGSFGIDVRVRRDELASAQLRALGHDPASLPLVVMTHLHFDHLGGSAQFPAAEFVADERELEHPPAVLRGTYAHHRDAVHAWRRVRPGGFDAPHDLFDDGSVLLVHTPGHTPGHLSLVLRATGGRTVLLTGDAAYTRRTLDERLTPLFVDDHDAYLRSLDALRAWVAERAGGGRSLVVCGHDPQSWPATVAALQTSSTSTSS